MVPLESKDISTTSPLFSYNILEKNVERYSIKIWNMVIYIFSDMFCSRRLYVYIEDRYGQMYFSKTCIFSSSNLQAVRNQKRVRK